MQISKLSHEKLLAALEHAEADARAGREAAQRFKLKADELEADLKKARAQVEGLTKQWAESSERSYILTEKVRGREAALVQLALRIAPYGDPAVTP
jgi:predicted nuclease with TOPRIM domain